MKEREIERERGAERERGYVCSLLTNFLPTLFFVVEEKCGERK